MWDWLLDIWHWLFPRSLTVNSVTATPGVVAPGGRTSVKVSAHGGHGALVFDADKPPTGWTVTQDLKDTSLFLYTAPR